ncbi:TPA: hypothetical protein MH604_06990 [Klebsiella pneumoniae]|nr:hypothetical protein [Klebsiella pneumoniae]
MSPIDDLTIGFETLVSLIKGLDIRLDAATQPACFVIFFQAESEFLSRMTRLEGFECIRNQFDVMHVRCGDDQLQRKPVGTCHQTAL